MASVFDLSTKARLKYFMKVFTDFEYNGSVYVKKIDEGEIWIHLYQDTKDDYEIQVNITLYSPEGYDFQLFHGHIESISEFSVIFKTLKIDLKYGNI